MVTKNRNLEGKGKVAKGILDSKKEVRNEVEKK
jgi:hypothetical protein